MYWGGRKCSFRANRIIFGLHSTPMTVMIVHILNCCCTIVYAPSSAINIWPPSIFGRNCADARQKLITASHMWVDLDVPWLIELSKSQFCLIHNRRYDRSKQTSDNPRDQNKLPIFERHSWKIVAFTISTTLSFVHLATCCLKANSSVCSLSNAGTTEITPSIIGL